MKNYIHYNFMEIKQNYLVSLANELIKSSYTISLVEKRLIFLILSKIKGWNALRPHEWSESISSEVFYSVSAEDYAQVCGIEVHKAREELRQAADTLYNRTIRIQENNKTLKEKRIDFRWIQSKAEYTQQGVFEIKFSHDIIPYLSDLRVQFTKFHLEEVMEFRSIYSWRLYELIKIRKFEKQKVIRFVYTPGELMTYFDVPVSLMQYKNLKQVALLPACREIEEKSLIEFVKTEKNGFFEEKKIGKTVKSLIFSIKFK